MLAELQHETWPIERLIEYDRNPRKNEVNDAVNRVASAIHEYGFRVPVIAKSDGTIVDGHLRLKAARKLGLLEVPIVLADDMTDAQVKAFRISVNKMAELAEWDEELLALEFADLEAMDFDLELTGFSLDEIEAFDFDGDNETEGLTDPDEIPDVQDEPVSKLGDVWLLGKHLVMNGDSTSITDVEKLMDGGKAEMVFTDPPYGINIVDKNTKKIGADNLAKNKEYSEVIGDDSTDTASDFYNTCVSLGLKKFIIWGGNYFLKFLPFSKSWIIWDKRGDMNSNNFADGEMAWTNIESRVRIYKQIWNGMIREGERENRVHPNQKPVKMLTEIIDDFTEVNDIIYDGFLGSGSTLIAAEKTNRICYGLEISPHYTDVICQRWSNFTGLQPTLESTGQTFNEVKEAMSG
jgi:DNA modification methylase